MIKANYLFFLSKVANQFDLFIYLCMYLFVCLFFVKHFDRFMLTLNTFEDAIHPQADHMSVACTACFSAGQFMTLMQRLVRTI